MNTLITALKHYFNNVLKKYVYYPEKFDIEHDKINNQFILIPTTDRYLLSDKLENDEELLSRIESALSKTITENMRHIEKIEVIPLPDGEIMIEYHKYFTQFGDIDKGPYANIASNMTYDQIIDLCVSSKEFAKVCRNDLFWIELINRNYPRYKYASGLKHVTNYQNFYKDMSKYYQALLKYREEVKKFKFMEDKDINRVDAELYHWVQSFIVDNIEALKYLINVGEIPKNGVSLTTIVRDGVIFLDKNTFEKLLDTADKNEIELLDSNVTQMIFPIWGGNRKLIIPFYEFLKSRNKQDYVHNYMVGFTSNILEKPNPDRDIVYYLLENIKFDNVHWEDFVVYTKDNEIVEYIIRSLPRNNLILALSIISGLNRRILIGDKSVISRLQLVREYFKDVLPKID
jgi:hypothetical protein